jgi:hypothetical protein
MCDLGLTLSPSKEGASADAADANANTETAGNDTGESIPRGKLGYGLWFVYPVFGSC